MSDYTPTRETQVKGGQQASRFKHPSTIMSTKRKNELIKSIIKKAEEGDTECQLWVVDKLLDPTK